MLDWLFSRRKLSEQRSVVRGDVAAVEPIELRVAVVIHDPLLEQFGGRRLHEAFNWHDPDQLLQRYIADLRLASGGIARYTVVERHLVDAYPQKLDGFRYNDERYMRCWRLGSGFHQPDAVDYQLLLDEFDLVRKVVQGQIDEVWLFAFPFAGYYESHMVGAGAIWCNSPPLLERSDCTRRFVIMGFNYERDVGCMLENFGHRVESIMAHVYRHQRGEANLWERFIRYEQSHPGGAECGNVHFAPSSTHDYDWDNPRPVMARADNWYRFPNLSGPPRELRADEWGGGDMRLHHLWWLDHLPRAPGATNGIMHNWWRYVLRPDIAL